MNDKYKELEANVDKLEDLVVSTPPRVLDYEIDGYVEGADLVQHKASFWDKAKRSLLSGTTFDFLRHFMIGFVGVGGTAIATTGNLGWSLIAGVAGGLVEGGRKVWSGTTASKNGGTKNRVLQKLLELIVALIDMWIKKRREGEDGK